MANTTKRNKIAKETLYQIGYKYLCDNFHKFSKANKIKVSLAVLQIFEKDDSKTKIPTAMKVIVQIENENKTPQESGNRISQYIEI